MTKSSTETNKGPDIKKGNSCLLSVTGRHFMVEILDVKNDTICVSFPGLDYPVEGMWIEMEFHDKSGFSYYRVKVLKGPGEGDGLTLERPREPRRNQHRDSFRVPTDLTVQVRDQIHIRKYDAALLDLSSGGALIQTDAPFDFNTTVEISLSLPGETAHNVLAQVVHMVEHNKTKRGPVRVYGIKLIGIQPEALISISRYVWNRLRDLYPTT